MIQKWVSYNSNTIVSVSLKCSTRPASLFSCFNKSSQVASNMFFYGFFNFKMFMAHVYILSPAINARFLLLLMKKLMLWLKERDSYQLSFDVLCLINFPIIFQRFNDSNVERCKEIRIQSTLITCFLVSSFWVFHKSFISLRRPKIDIRFDPHRRSNKFLSFLD